MRHALQTIKAGIQRQPVLIYFVLVLLISYGSFALIVAPGLLSGHRMQNTVAETTLFPIMDLGVCSVALALTALLDGREGLREVASRFGRWRVGARWYAVALLPPALILVVLLPMHALISPVYMPKVFALGALFGLPAVLEEVGWMGFAFPHMRRRQSALAAAVTLGVLWGLWHAPVVDYLGAAAPHGAYWAPFFLSFIAIVTAMRVLIVWVYTNARESLLLATLMHISMTGSLVVLDPTGVSPAQETLWYALYAAALWLIVAIVVMRYGKNLRHAPQAEAAPQFIVSGR